MIVVHFAASKVHKNPKRCFFNTQKTIENHHKLVKTIVGKTQNPHFWWQKPLFFGCLGSAWQDRKRTSLAASAQNAAKVSALADLMGFMLDFWLLKIGFQWDLMGFHWDLFVGLVGFYAILVNDGDNFVGCLWSTDQHIRSTFISHPFLSQQF